ncbi:guanylate kinase [Melanomma pulvis-pyrius CBS 109.77]|uniref:Guanylate kinase n=1 Tax=Melanomma pulvis-pyrius CBS 109.77 TaxID=1314802 RepID=A0A6A6X381_9PLEO|nr:guanylate kinase [Melanomma pulvis-pyrius CBS 109.77]
MERVVFKKNPLQIVDPEPSGVGKGTLFQKFYDAHPDVFALTVSHTTRQPRVGEVEGVAYFFVSPSTFSSLISQDFFIEGVKRIKASSINARHVFIKPPSLETLETRLRNRGTKKEEGIQKRLAQAKVELEYADTPGVQDKIIVNNGLEKAYVELEEFVFKQLSRDGKSVC